MGYYKVLLVDDEEDVRRSIVKKLDWHALGFEVAGEAGNGDEALEMAENLLPDVIMTDIKMPFMDGLELCRRARNLLPGVRLAIFSGFDEFEYAREAIANQVEEYILKPINATELADVFSRIRQNLDEEIDRRRNMERLRRYYEESFPLIRQQVLSDLLEGRIAPGEARVKGEEYGVPLGEGPYCVAVVKPVREDTPAPPDMRLLLVSLGRLIEDAMAQRLPHYLVQRPGRIVLIAMPLEGQDSVKFITDELNRLFPLAKKLLGIRLGIGLGKVYAEPAGIPGSYADAQNALGYQVLMEEGHCLYIGDIEPGISKEHMPDIAFVDDVIMQIKVGNGEQLQKSVNRLTLHLKNGNFGMRQYQIYMLELSTELFKLARNYRLNPEESGLQNLLGASPWGFSNLEEMGRWLFTSCNGLRRLIRQERKDTTRLLVDRAQDMLAREYMDSELSLDTVCTRLNVSQAYLSTLFKRETGQGFINYLTTLRMEKALELLANTDDKTYQIAEKVGYADPNYFSYVFKRQYGTSPSKYRNDRTHANEKAESDPGAG